MSNDSAAAEPVPSVGFRARFGPWVIPIAAWTLYVLLYPSFYATLDIHTGVLAFVPVFLTALRGAWPGAAAGFVAAPVTAAVHNLFGIASPLAWMLAPSALIGAGTMIAIGFAVGRMRELDRDRQAESRERQRVEQYLRELEVRLVVSNDIARAMRDGQPADAIVKSAVDSLHAHFPRLRSTFLLVDPDGRVSVSRAVGPAGTDWPADEILTLPPDVLAALPKRDLVAIEDTSSGIEDGGLVAQLAASNVRALLDAPVHHSDTLVGLLSLDSPHPRGWTAHERSTLREAADLLGVALRDADTRRQIEESERKFRLVAESSQAMIALLQEEGAVYLNPAFVRISGYSRDEPVTTSLWDIIHPDDVEMIRSYRRRRLSREEAPTRYETRIITKDGRTRWLDIRASSFELDGRPTVLTTGLDVTERKLAEQDLRARERQLRTLLEYLGDGVALMVDDKIIYANPGLARMLGTSVEEVVGRHPLDNLTPRERQRAAARLELANQGEFGASVEYELLRDDGDTVPVLVRSQRIELEGRVAVLSVVRDLSEQRELEEQLRQTQRLESVGQLAGGVAHNFNNALAAIIGYAELTLRELPDDHAVM